MKRDGFDVLVRGIRGVSDFAYEYQMAGVNSMLMPGVDTVFLQTEPSLQFVASSYVKEIASLGGDVGAFVSPRVLKPETENSGLQAVSQRDFRIWTAPIPSVL